MTSDASHDPTGSCPPFLAGGGEATRLLMARDWSNHPLGPPDGWPSALKVAISLILNSPESMILAWGPDLWFFFNETFFPLLGPRLPWAMGERFDRVWADGWDQARPIIDAALAGRPERFVDLPWKLATDRGAEDTWWSFSYSRVLAADGSVAGLFILTNETTARVLTDAALVRSQRELDAALRDVRAANDDLEHRVEQRTAERDRMWDTSPDLLVVLDHDGRIRRINPAWETILGWTAEDLAGSWALDLVHPDDLGPTLAALGTAQTGPLPIFENRFRHRDGSYRWASWVGAPAGDEIFAIGRHVTAQKEAEAALRHAEDQLRQAQKVEAVGQLTGGVAHDFNNLLTVIRGSVDLLRRPTLTDERRARYIDAIADTADRAARLTGQLLAFARRQALNPEVIDVGASVKALKTMIQTLSGPRIRLSIEVPEQAVYVDVDQGQLDNSIINMAVNARDAIAGKAAHGGAGDGMLRITVGASGRLRNTTGNFVTIALSDTGPGVAAEDVERIFEPFYTTKGIGAGTGLGLSQVIGFAKQSGGDVLLDSRAGQGATFTLYLPRVAPPHPASGAGEAMIDPAASDHPAGGCILVVEDDAEVGSFAIHALHELGYNTVLAGSAVGALAELEADRDRFDAVFSDVLMPGMSGIDMAAEIERRYPDLPVVLTSGYSRALAADGVQGRVLIRKPYRLEDLSQVFARTLRRVRAGRTGRE